MPVSKHRKKGQKKAVARPGRARVVKEPAYEAQQRALEMQAFDMVEIDSLNDHEADLIDATLMLVLDEVLAMNVAGTAYVGRIGSRAAVVEELLDECADAGESDPQAAVDWALGRLETAGFIRFDEDQLILAVPLPPPAG